MGSFCLQLGRNIPLHLLLPIVGNVLVVLRGFGSWSLGSLVQLASDLVLLIECLGSWFADSLFPLFGSTKLGLD